MEEDVRVLFEDERIVVVDKPAGLLVHRSAVDRSETRFLLPRVRDAVGARVYPVHRLDKGTSGAVVFAKDAEAASALSALFRADRVTKRYRAIVRGWLVGEVEVDHPLAPPADPRAGIAAKDLRQAQTTFRGAACSELACPVGRYATARYSLVECLPRTGRRHQIRRHLKHLHHPIIGDANYGDLRHNRFVREELGVARLLLAHVEIAFEHPFRGEALRVCAPLAPDFDAAIHALGLHAGDGS